MRFQFREIIKYLVGASLLALLVTTTIWLTMPKVPESASTLTFHFPLFFFVSISTLLVLPHAWRGFIYFAATIILFLELVFYMNVVQV